MRSTGILSFIPGWKADGNLPKLWHKTGAVVLFLSSSFYVPFGERRSLISCAAATKRGRKEEGREAKYLSCYRREKKEEEEKRRRRRRGLLGKKGEDRYKKSLTSFSLKRVQWCVKDGRRIL